MQTQEEILAEIEAEVSAIRNKRERKEVLMQRGLLPKAHLGTTSATQSRSIDLKTKDYAFLDYVRHGANMHPDSQKALVEDATGQYLVSPAIETEIERVVEELVTIRGLASKRTIDKDRLQVRGMTEVTMSWGKLETGSDIPESDLTPSAPVYKYAEDLYGLSKVGEDELADSDVELAAYLADSFGRVIAEKENEAFIKGAGHGSQEPEGITLDATLISNTVVTAVSGAVTVEKFLEMIYQVPAQYRKGSTFIVNSLTELELRKLRWKDAAGTYEGGFIWQQSIQAGLPNTFLGYGILSDDNMETLAGTEKVIAIFGNYVRGYKIIDRKGISIQRLSELYSEAGLVGFKCHARVGGYMIKASNKALVLLTEAA